jgi:NmrA-like family
MTNDRTILITGVTGQQGGAVAQSLQGKGFHLRGLTRKPDSERAAALARHGVDIVQGDLDDEATLRRVLAGAWGVFGVQNAGEAGVEREETQGKRLATLAREAGVEHYVYTSVGIGEQTDGRPALRQQVAHRGNRARPPFPLACDPASRVLHGEPAGAFQSPGLNAGLGARAKHEATDDYGGRHRLVRRARVHRRRRLEPPRDRSRR